MKELQKRLLEERELMGKLVPWAEKILEHAPEGILAVKRNKNSDQFYLRQEASEKNGEYICKKNKKLIQALAQKDYAREILVQAQHNKKELERFLGKYQFDLVNNQYDQLSPARKKLVVPYGLSKEQYIEQWKKQKFKRKEGPQNGIVTENGEMVRSKSEKILADKLKLMGVPYHYEKPLYLKGFGIIYPDFTVLNVRTRREYYWEHFGMVDMPQYAEKMIKKIETMGENDIFSGEKLIVTFETKGQCIKSKTIEKMIQRYLL